MKEDITFIEEARELLPKSRKGIELGSGEIPRHFGLYDYNMFVYDCQMTPEMQRSLLYYASRFNWENRKPCTASLQRMSNDLKVGRKYLKQPLEDLQAYGWVTFTRGRKNTYLVTPRIGREVPGELWRDPEHKRSQLLYDNGLSEDTF